MSEFLGGVRRLLGKLPSGVELTDEDWALRHRWIVRLLWLHVPIVIAWGFVEGSSVLHNLAEGAPLALCALLATKASWLRRWQQAVVAGLGLMLSSAVLVHLSGGVTELHFHFFVMLGVISLYQDWRPFGIAIGFVALHHGLIGKLRPRDVFDHPDAWRSPLKWAALHAFFVLCSSAVSIASWGIIEASHRRSKESLEASERRFRSLIEHATDVVTVVDEDGVIVYDSPACGLVLGYAVDARVGRPALEFVHPDDRDRAAAALGDVSETARMTVSVEVRVLHHDGSYRSVEASVTNLLHEPSVAGIVANFRDVTDRRILEDQLAHQAFHDPLTGLANRALMSDRVDHALRSRRHGADDIAVVYLDIDDFKTVNDGLGHDSGDALLRHVGERLSAVVRPGDTVCRMGGDEFAILLEHLANPAVAYEIGGRLLEAVAEPCEEAGGLIVNASIGIALADSTDDSVNLLRNADLAMYRAKHAGKGRFEIYEAGMHAQVVARVRLKGELRRAIDNGEFVPYYQPIVETATGRLLGVEALVRWNHPDGRLVSPAEFIPVAEETGMIVQMGSAVLNRACADAVRWQAELGPAAPPSVSVNLSPRQIQDPGVVDEVASALRRSGLAPEHLTLEITESILVDDTDAAATTLSRLKRLGVSIALDDFGTGYSSLTYLDRFPVDVLKIDKSFIDSLLTTSEPGSPLVAAIVNLGSMLGLRVTAEGVETTTQLDRLQSMGCQQAQGFYFARPMADDDLRRYCADRVTAAR